MATPEPVEPIGEHRQSVVIDTTGRYIARAGELFNRRFKPIEVLFDLKGKTAGIYRVKRGTRAIRYNPWILSKYFEHGLANTVPHEVAHYIADKMYGLARIRPHGDEWKHIMLAFGADPVRTCDYDLGGIPSRQYRTFAYRCGCTEHAFTSRRHNQVVKRRKVYFCRKCRSKVVAVNDY